MGDQNLHFFGFGGVKKYSDFVGSPQLISHYFGFNCLIKICIPTECLDGFKLVSLSEMSGLR